jgi:hypothetical protein
MTIWRMRTACWITKATNTHAYTQNMQYLLLHNRLIPTFLVKCFTQTQTNTKKLLHHISAITVSLAKLNASRWRSANEPSFFFDATWRTLHEALHTFYCCSRHKFAIKALLCITHYYTVHSDV